MAKSKKTPKKVVEEEEISQDTSAEVDIDLDAADVEDVDAEPKADDAEAEADEAEAQLDDGEGGDDSAGDEPAGPPPPPKPKITKTAIALILLNWVAAPAFLTLAVMDHSARVQYSYRALINYTQIWGLPLRGEPAGDKTIGGEEDFASVSNETRPVIRLSHDELNQVFKKRPGVKSMGGKDVFEPVEEPVPVRLRPSDMSDEFLEDIYGSAVPKNERYKTLEEAIEDMRNRVPADIAAAAKEVRGTYEKKKEDEKRKFVKESIFMMTWDSNEAKKKDEEIDGADAKALDDLVKRALVQKILYPLAPDLKTLDALDTDLAKAKGAELDAFVEDAVERRLYHDILAPLNVFRPGDLKVTDVERIADRDKVKKERLKELLEKRFAASIASKYDPAFHIGKDYWGNPQDRDSVEKRQQVAFILFTLGQVQVPVLDKKLYAKGIERAQTVCGIYEFTGASLAYVQTLRDLEQRLAAKIIDDREGTPSGPPGKESNTPGFTTERERQVQLMQRLVEHVDSAQKRLDELKAQRDHAKKIYEQRQAQHKDVTEKLIKARQGTEKYVKELRVLQNQLHDALLELSDAADTNFRLEAQIRALELSYYKTPPQKGGKK